MELTYVIIHAQFNEAMIRGCEGLAVRSILFFKKNSQNFSAKLDHDIL